MVALMKFKTLKPDPKLLRLDLGAGKGATKPDGFIGVDVVKHAGVDKVVDLRKPWPWRANSVDAVNCAMLIHYLAPKERVHFFNELWRVLKPDAQATITTPMWSSHRAYIDMQAQWPPVSEGFYHTLNRDWRAAQNAVDTSGLRCHFEAGAGYSLHPAIAPRSQEYQHDAVTWSKEAAQDLIATLTKRK
jgi:SAM-dependent methyltransferase